MSTADLVDAILSNNASDIQSELNSVLMQKVADRIEDLRTTVAQGMFQSEEVIDEEIIGKSGKATIHFINGMYEIRHPNQPPVRTPDRSVAEELASHIGQMGAVRKEEVELDEKLSASASIADWIRDFITSDDPRFAGKSKEERRKMAIGAYYGAQRAK